MKEPQIGDMVAGQGERGYVEGLVVKLAPIYGPGGWEVGKDAFVLDTRFQTKNLITGLRDPFILKRHTLEHAIELARRGFKKTGDGSWQHPQQRWLEVTRVEFPPSDEPVPPDMEQVIAGVRALYTGRRPAP